MTEFDELERTLADELAKIGAAADPPEDAWERFVRRLDSHQSTRADGHGATISIEPTDGPRPIRHRRWLLPAIAAVTVAAVAVGLVLVAADDDDPAPVDEPVPTTATTTSTTTPERTEEAAIDTIERFFTAYNNGDADTALAMLTDDVTVTEGYDGTRPDPDVEPIANPDQHLAWRLARGETLTGPDCRESDPAPIEGITLRCVYSTQPPDGAPIPTRSMFTVVDGGIAEIDQRYGEPVSAPEALDFREWIFLSYPELWTSLFADPSSAEEATERGLLRAQWFQQYEDQCADHACDPPPWANSPNDWDDDKLDFALGLREPRDPRWRNPEASSVEVPYELPWIDQSSCDPWPLDWLDYEYYSYGSFFWEPAQAGLPSLAGYLPARASAEQAQAAIQQILATPSCSTFPHASEPVRVEELPAWIPAQGFIVNNEYALFAITNPRGGLVMLSLADGTVTAELIAELAGRADALLAEATP